MTLVDLLYAIKHCCHQGLTTVDLLSGVYIEHGCHQDFGRSALVPSNSALAINARSDTSRPAIWRQDLHDFGRLALMPLIYNITQF
jgi:hypothetical protein